MIYDSLKVLKKVIKYWWIYLLTIIIAVGVYFLPFANKLQYIENETYRIECFSSDAADFEYYEFAQNKAMTELQQNFYILEKNIKEEHPEIDEISVESATYNSIYVKIVGSTKTGVSDVNNIIKTKISAYLKDTMLVKAGYDQSKKITPVIEAVQNSPIVTESHKSGIASKILLVGVAVLLIEVFAFAVVGCYDNKLYFKGELKDKFNKSILIDNLDASNKKLLMFQLNKLKEQNKNIVSLDCNIKSPNILGSNLDFNQEATKEKLLNADCVIINVMCEKSSCKDIGEIIDFCEAQNIKQIYFVLLKNLKIKKG